MKIRTPTGFRNYTGLLGASCLRLDSSHCSAAHCWNHVLRVNVIGSNSTVPNCSISMAKCPGVSNSTGEGWA